MGNRLEEALAFAEAVPDTTRQRLALAVVQRGSETVIEEVMGMGGGVSRDAAKWALLAILSPEDARRRLEEST